MVWCSYCAKDQQAERDDINGFTCCTGCGRVLDDNVYGADPTFTKTAGGQSQLEGNFVKDGQNSFGRIGAGAGRILGYQSDSHEKTLAKGKLEIVDILERLSIRPRDDSATQAHRFYTIALERNFTRGRRTQHVAASCIYIVCRQNKKPYMLIDFSDCLQTNVYVLGAVFLQLCHLLRLEEQPFMQKPVDPSLFIHRFADRLQFGKKMNDVSQTALRLVASMKRDWMQTGRRPSGICGAALFIAAHIHGFERSKGDVVSVVHVCEATLKRRLVEFETTESSSLTVEEFEAKGKEMQNQMRLPIREASIKDSKSSTEVLCEHRDCGVAHFSHGLCRPCYDEFVNVSGGIQGGSAPPAFQRAEMLRMQTVRDQLKSQGLNSDDEDEEGTVVYASRKSKELAPSTVADMGQSDCPSRERGRGRGRGRGRCRARGAGTTNGDMPSTGDDKETCSSEHLHGMVKLRGGGKGRGIRRHDRNGDQLTQQNNGRKLQAPATAVQNQGIAETSSVLQPPGHENNGAEVLDAPDGVPSQHESSNVRSTPSHERSLMSASNAEVNIPQVGSPKAMGTSRTPSSESRCATGIRSQIGMETSSIKDLRESGPSDSQVEDQGKSEPENLPGDCVPQSIPEAPPAAAQPSGDGIELGSVSQSGDMVDEDILSDLDDDELIGYMNNEEEVRLKTIIWTEMNKEYIQEQEAKEAALAAQEEARAAAVAAVASNSASAAELAAAAAAAVVAQMKDRKQKRADEAKRPPAQSAAEATRQMLESKRLSTKVDYTVLAKLFDANESERYESSGKIKEDEDEDEDSTDAANRSSKRTRPSSHADGSQADSVITQISARRSVTREVNSKEGSVSAVEMDEEAEGDIVDEMAEDGVVDAEGEPYGYDEADDYYDDIGDGDDY